MLHYYVKNLVVTIKVTVEGVIDYVLVFEHFQNGFIYSFRLFFCLVSTVRVVRLDTLQEDIEGMKIVLVSLFRTGHTEMRKSDAVSIDFAEADRRVSDNHIDLAEATMDAESLLASDVELAFEHFSVAFPDLILCELGHILGIDTSHLQLGENIGSARGFTRARAAIQVHYKRILHQSTASRFLS